MLPFLFFASNQRNMNYQIYTYTVVNNQCKLAVKKIVDRILRSGKISRQDHVLLTSTVLVEGHVSEGDCRQINRLFDHIQTGQLKLIDW
jgi:acetamidase/formamidase